MPANDLVLDMRLNYATLKRDIAGAKGVLSGFAATIGGVSVPARRALATIGAAVGLAVREFANADHAAEGLRSALAANGHEVDANYARLVKFSNVMRDNTTYSAAFVQELEATALNLGISAEQVDAVTKAGIGLGQKFFNGDAIRGVTAAAAAVQGNTEKLNEMIPALRRTHTEQGRLNLINKAATAGFAEAQMKAKTFGGSLSSLARSFHEAGAAVGSAFAPEIQKLAGFVESVSAKIAGMTDSQKEALVTQTELAAGAAGAAIGLGKVGTVVTGLRGVFGAAMPLIGGVAIALTGIGSLFVNLTGKGETFGERLNDTWEKVKRGAGVAFDWIGKRFGDLEDLLIMGYFRINEAFGGDDAEKMMAAYLKDVEESSKKAQAAREKATKDAVGKEVNLHKEGAREIRAAIGTIPDAYRAMQLAILKGGAGQVGVGPGGVPAGAPGGQRPGGVDQPARDAIANANARRLKAAKDEKAKLEEQLQAAEYGDKHPDQVLQLEAAIRKRDEVIARGGANKPYAYNNLDNATERMAFERDREADQGQSDRSQQRIRKAVEEYERARKMTPEARNRPETDDENAKRTLGSNPSVWGEAAKKLGQAGDAIAKVFSQPPADRRRGQGMTDHSGADQTVFSFRSFINMTPSPSLPELIDAVILSLLEKVAIDPDSSTDPRNTVVVAL
jgi:hypothetical protein